MSLRHLVVDDDFDFGVAKLIESASYAFVFPRLIIFVALKVLYELRKDLDGPGDSILVVALRHHLQAVSILCLVVSAH